jgi:hypothetical protein
MGKGQFAKGGRGGIFGFQPCQAESASGSSRILGFIMELFITRYIQLKNHRVIINGAVQYVAEEPSVPRFLRSIYHRSRIDYPKFFKMDNLSKLGFLSAEILLQGTDILQKYPGEDLGIILGNARSSLESDEKHQEFIRDRKKYSPSPSVFVYTLPNIMAGEIAIRHKIKGENTVFIFEGFDPGFMVPYISELFRNRRVEGCISGWVDCYGDHYESFLFIAEREERIDRYPELQDRILFNPRTVEKLYKGEGLSWKI